MNLTEFNTGDWIKIKYTNGSTGYYEAIKLQYNFILILRSFNAVPFVRGDVVHIDAFDNAFIKCNFISRLDNLFSVDYLKVGHSVKGEIDFLDGGEIFFIEDSVNTYFMKTNNCSVVIFYSNIEHLQGIEFFCESFEQVDKNANLFPSFVKTFYFPEGENIA